MIFIYDLLQTKSERAVKPSRYQKLLSTFRKQLLMNKGQIRKFLPYDFRVPLTPTLSGSESDRQISCS